MLNSLLQRLKLQNPIILAPLAGGPSSPELAAAICNAGGLGSLGLEYLTLDQMRDAIRRTRELTSGAINANLFAPMPRPSAYLDTTAAMAEVAKAHLELGIEPPEPPKLSAENFDEKFAAVLEARPEVFSFTF